MNLLGMAIVEGMAGREPKSWILVLWIMGTFVFAGYFNWSVNGQTLIPLVPVVGIVTVRALDRAGFFKLRFQHRIKIIALTAGGLLSLSVLRADTKLAEASQLAAQEIKKEYGSRPHDIWFQGH